MAGRWDRCYSCKVGIWLTEEQEQMLRQSSQTFYCIWGHGQVFAKGETEETKLRRERDRLKQETARLEEGIASLKRANAFQIEQREMAERREAAQKGVVTKLKKRAVAGVCPCCNRTFAGLARHMQNKHPTFKAEAIQ